MYIGVVFVPVSTPHHLGLFSSLRPLFRETVCDPEVVVTNVISCCSSVNVKLNLLIGHVHTDLLLFCCVTFSKTSKLSDLQCLRLAKGLRQRFTELLAHSRHTAGMLAKL